MVIILNGSLGVGKTSTSWALQRKFDKSIMLDGDYIGAVHPFDLHCKERLAYLFDTLANLVHFHQKNGYTNFVINYVFENESELQGLTEKLTLLDEEVHCFWLTCTPTIQQERIRKRNNRTVDYELVRCLVLNDILEKANEEGFIGQKIATQNYTISGASNQIWSIVLP